MSEPSPNGRNGHAANGQFAPGNAGGPGNPHAARVAKIRAALLDAVTDEDVRGVARKLVEMAKAGDLMAIRELLDRCIGKPAAVVGLDVRHDGQPAPEAMPLPPGQLASVRRQLVAELAATYDFSKPPIEPAGGNETRIVVVEDKGWYGNDAHARPTPASDQTRGANGRGESTDAN